MSPVWPFVNYCCRQRRAGRVELVATAGAGYGRLAVTGSLAGSTNDRSSRESRGREGPMGGGEYRSRNYRGPMSQDTVRIVTTLGRTSTFSAPSLTIFLREI